MGLDASVRCRCFEEGELNPGPVPVDDLYIDADGYLSSRTLDSAREQYDYRRFDARYGALEDEFYEWLHHPCGHADGEQCCEWVSNWSGVSTFKSLVEEFGGEQEFPILSTMLPSGNGGLFPADQASAALEELDRFTEMVVDVSVWELRDAECDEVVRFWTKTEAVTWMMGPRDCVGAQGGYVFFKHAGRPCVRTNHFKQMPLGKPDANGCQQMYIVALDTGEATETFNFLGLKGMPKAEQEFYVTSGNMPLYEGEYGVAERLRRLLLAAQGTGNPIRWA